MTVSEKKEVHRGRAFNLTRGIYRSFWGQWVQLTVWRIRGKDPRTGTDWSIDPEPCRRINVRIPSTDNAKNLAKFDARVNDAIKELTKYLVRIDKGVEMKDRAILEKRERQGKISQGAVGRAMKDLFGPPGGG